MAQITLEQYKDKEGYELKETDTGYTVTKKQKYTSRGEQKEFTSENYEFNKEGELISGYKQQLRTAGSKNPYETPYTSVKYKGISGGYEEDIYELNERNSPKFLERNVINYSTGQSTQTQQSGRLTETQKAYQEKIVKAQAEKEAKAGISSLDKFLLQRKQELNTPTKQEDFIKNIYSKMGKEAYIDAGGNLLVVPKGTKVNPRFINNLTNPRTVTEKEGNKKVMIISNEVTKEDLTGTKGKKLREFQEKTDNRFTELKQELKESKQFLETTGETKGVKTALVGATYVGVNFLEGFTAVPRHPIKSLLGVVNLVTKPKESIKGVITSFKEEPIASTSQIAGSIAFFKTVGAGAKAVKKLDIYIKEAPFRKAFRDVTDKTKTWNYGNQEITLSKIQKGTGPNEVMKYTKNPLSTAKDTEKYGGYNLPKEYTVTYIKEPGFPVIDKTGAITKARQTQLTPKDYDYLDLYQKKPNLNENIYGDYRNVYGITESGKSILIDRVPAQTTLNEFVKKLSYKEKVTAYFMEDYYKKIPATPNKPSIEITRLTEKGLGKNPKEVLIYSNKVRDTQTQITSFKDYVPTLEEVQASRIPRATLKAFFKSKRGSIGEGTYKPSYETTWGETGSNLEIPNTITSEVSSGPILVKAPSIEPYTTTFLGIGALNKYEPKQEIIPTIEDKSIIKTYSSPAIINKTNQSISPIQEKKVIQESTPALNTGAILKSSQASAQELITEQKSELIQEPISDIFKPTQKTIKTTKPPTPKPKPPTIFSLDKEYEPRVIKPSYTLFLKRKGFFTPVFETDNPQEAILQGKFLTDTTASASFKIASSDSSFNIQDLASTLLPKSTFRPSKKDSDIFVEKRRFRINTPGEKRDITFLGINKRRGKKQNGIFL